MGEWDVSPRWFQLLGCFAIEYHCTSWLAGAVTYSEVVSDPGCFQSFGKLLPQGVRGTFDPTRFVLELSSLSQGWRKQMYYKGFTWDRGGQGESMCCACGSWSVGPKSLEATASGCWAPGFIICRFFCFVLFFHHSPHLHLMSLSFSFKDLGLCLWVFLPLFTFSFYLTDHWKHYF